jgi:hypothetical protein
MYTTDYAQLHLDVAFDHSNGKIIWQPRISARVVVADIVAINWLRIIYARV